MKPSLSPTHIAVIMDGNGRWAQQRLRPRTFGHIKGTRTAKKIITACSKRGIKYLTLYAFSTENWLRPEYEVDFLMQLLRRYLKREKENLMRENIRFDTIGEVSRLPKDVQAAIHETRVATQNNTGLHLIFAISYGARQEITTAVKKICEQIEKGKIRADDITEAYIQAHLATAVVPDPDLIIRTSGENRLSNFLLWQSAYSEFYFTETLWPDFTEEHLELALSSYKIRERRYGRVLSAVNSSPRQEERLKEVLG